MKRIILLFLLVGALNANASTVSDTTIVKIVQVDGCKGRCCVKPQPLTPQQKRKRRRGLWVSVGIWATLIGTVIITSK
jgi:hypothetical protein